jgi:hypothetical protein
MPYIIRPRQVCQLAAGLIGAFLITGAAPALAATSCPSVVISQPFAKFGDNANYTLVEGGLFEEGAPGWSSSNSEIINESPEEENQSYYVSYEVGHQRGRSHSLAIQPGGEAVSAPFCVNSEYPSFRFFAHQLRSSSGFLEVSLRWSNGQGTHETSDATLEGSRRWTLSPVLELASKLPAGTTPSVRLVFQPSPQGSWAIDDVYIDPYAR